VGRGGLVRAGLKEGETLAFVGGGKSPSINSLRILEGETNC